MSYLKGFLASLGMFSILPVPHFIWNDAIVAKMIPTFPFVGLVIGLLWWFFAGILMVLHVPTGLFIALLGVFVPIITGFIHLDGYMDTADAILSRRMELTERRRILKDPTTGCFAVIAFGLYLLLWVCGLMGLLERGISLKILILIPILARSVGGIAVMALPSMTEQGYGAGFRKGAQLSSFVIPVFAIICAVMGAWYLVDGWSAFACLGAVGVGFLVAMGCYRNLEGFNGDLAGCTIILTELTAVLLLGCI